MANILKKVVLFSIIFASFGVSGQAIYADTAVSSSENSRISTNGYSAQSRNPSQVSTEESSSSDSMVSKNPTSSASSVASVSKPASIKSHPKIPTFKERKAVPESNSQASTTSAKVSVSSRPVTKAKKYVTLKKVTKVKAKAYVNKSQAGATYNLAGSGTHGQFSKATHQLKNYMKTTWVVNQYRYVVKADQKTALYFFVRSETGSQSGWVWHGYLNEKAVQTIGSTSNMKKAIYYRKSTSGKTYHISGPSYDAKFKATHALKNYPNTTWYVTKKKNVVNTKKHRVTYYYIQDSKKHAGWIWSGYLTKKVMLNVKRISQNLQLPTGCEITAVTMMVNYAGAKVSKMKLAKEMPRTKTKDGNKGFIGSPYSKSGWWVYPPALMKTVKKYTKSVINMTGSSFNSIKKQINKKHPVVVWISGYGGINTKINHAITIIGYSSSLVYFNDPWTGKQLSMTVSKLHSYRKRDAYRAISY
ncbi:C39 family peptidase [Pediococcus inopinatus]|uniref:C39 family peptidase n=1 Tax=Pediococcus inopinatus TaxID=114090 RepID=A0ABZ0Q4T1_9LACO|nr:C39 family peptidase [Pediococcus inopinatus]WPC19344.1 C39 family peptidase [Pediococcus inopinatus]WPC21137.1 C39 family peptidase [Pediococcus inopinatus]WPP09936.1 C39 family peptidase [Pediococcus inopinatus]